jgi:PKD repeat protein
MKSTQIQGVTDPENQPLTIETQCIMQDEKINSIFWLLGRYDGAGLSTETPRLRAERRNVFFSWKDMQWVKSEGRIYEIVFKASDSEGASCVGTVQVSVPKAPKKPSIDTGYRFHSLPGCVNCDAKPFNNPPIIVDSTPARATVNVHWEFTVVGHDPDSDVLSYSLVAGLDGMSIDPTTGLITWQPQAEHEGTQSISVAVTDPGGLSVSRSFEIIVEPAVDELSVSLIANPLSGTSPLAVRFSPVVNNNNIVINRYDWDFNSDGQRDRTDTFGAPQVYTYTGNPGDTFTATLTIFPNGGDPLTATRTITIDNQAPSVQVRADVTNGHAPLEVTFTVTAQDPQGINAINIDYESDGTIDDSVLGNSVTSGSWTFNNTYTNEGYFIATVTVTDSSGGKAVVSNNGISVDVNNPLDPVISLGASPGSGSTPLTTTLTAGATLYDNSTISQWSWDLDGDGTFETTGGNGATDTISYAYMGVDYYYPVVKVTTDSGRSALASAEIKTSSSSSPQLTIPNTSDTINSDAGAMATINISLPYQTELSLWIEDASGKLIKTIQQAEIRDAGNYSFSWDATDSSSTLVSEGDYYAVLGYTTYGIQHEIDLRTSTGGALTYYRRTTNNPSTFDRLKQPLMVNYGVDDPAEVTFFWQVSFGVRLMTLMEHERMGRGQYSLYWNGEYPNGQKLPASVVNLLPGILRYTLPDNVIFVKENPRIEDFTLGSTIISDPRREPIFINLVLSKASTIELIVADMDKGVNVAGRVYDDIGMGEQQLIWDARNNDDQYLAPGDYRIGVRSVDSRGNRSLYWYRTQHIEY